jgi:hypothetical protein
VADETTDASGMTATPPASWYPDPEHAGWQRYWDGQAWTEHRAPALERQVEITPGLVWVWITAVLSLFTFQISWSSGGDSTRIVIPFGLGFMIACLTLVARARADAERQAVELPGSYRAARIVAVALGALSTLGAVVTMLG